MIGYLEGTLLKARSDRILLLVNQIGYEILLPAVIMASIAHKKEGEPLFFYIYHHQTERQPLPVLIGFNSEEEKEFFQLLISVEAIGPLKAAQALIMPVEAVAAAIEAGDVDVLKQLKGIGSRTAHKIIATLRGKAARFTRDIVPETGGTGFAADERAELTMKVLVDQLGYKQAEARQMVADVLQENPAIETPEELLDRILKKR
ncbi:MAG: Holliday junction branch migration protein RuvA [Desulfosudaceae bacterium]